MTLSQGSALKGGIKGFGASDTSCGLELTLWCPTGETFWVIDIYFFLLWEHQKDWNRSQTRCAHGKAPLWTSNLQCLLNMRTQHLRSASRVFWTGVPDWGNPSTFWVFLPIFLPSVHRVPQHQTRALLGETSDKHSAFRQGKETALTQIYMALRTALGAFAI